MIEPLVSVIIPTRGRPVLLRQAVLSTLKQTYSNIEVLVVIDGPDPDTTSSLQSITDSRLRVLSLLKRVGGSDARNAGVRSAQGDWIAFLDDDDEWLAEKLRRQMIIGLQSEIQMPIIATKLLARRGGTEQVWPRRKPYKPLSEYLLTRSASSYGDGVLQTSTLVIRRALLLAVPFKSGLTKHQDLDWILRAVQVRGVEILLLDEALAIWNLPEGRTRVSDSLDWEFSLRWLRDSRALVTKRAYAGFVAVEVARQASAQKAWRQFFPLLYEMCYRGKPGPMEFKLFLGMWLPRGFRKALQRALSLIPKTRARSLRRTPEAENLPFHEV